MIEFMFVLLINALMISGVLLIRQIILTDSLVLVASYQITGFSIIAIGLMLAENTRNPNSYSLITIFMFTLIAMEARKILKRAK